MQFFQLQIHNIAIANSFVKSLYITQVSLTLNIKFHTAGKSTLEKSNISVCLMGSVEFYFLFRLRLSIASFKFIDVLIYV